MKKNNSNNGQTEMNNTKKANRKMMQKANQKRIQAEANARRKVAKSWTLVAQGIKYRKAAVKESCDRLTQIFEEELFDGILLNLSGRNGMRSYTPDFVIVSPKNFHRIGMLFSDDASLALLC